MDAVLHPEEVKAALDLTDAKQAALAEGYRKVFNATMDTRKSKRPIRIANDNGDDANNNNTNNDIENNEWQNDGEEF